MLAELDLVGLVNGIKRVFPEARVTLEHDPYGFPSHSQRQYITLQVRNCHARAAIHPGVGYELVTMMAEFLYGGR